MCIHVHKHTHAYTNTHTHADCALRRPQLHQGDLLGAAGGANNDGGPVGLIKLSNFKIFSMPGVAPLFHNVQSSSPQMCVCAPYFSSPPRAPLIEIFTVVAVYDFDIEQVFYHRPRHLSNASCMHIYLSQCLVSLASGSPLSAGRRHKLIVAEPMGALTLL